MSDAIKSGNGFKNLAGKKFGHLIVNYRSGTNKWKNALWNCNCDCGNIIEIEGGRLNKKENCGRQCKLNIKVNKGIAISNKYGRLTVVDVITTTKEKSPNRWKCQCECGNFVFKSTQFLISKWKDKKCGRYCGNSNGKYAIIGKKFGRLVVIKKDKGRSNKSSFWLCKCDCGMEKIIEYNSLTRGTTRSCGCIGARGNKGHYFSKLGVWEHFDSNWELLRMVMLDDKNLIWTKNHNIKINYQYEINNKKFDKIYIPDFYVINGNEICIEEIKGFVFSKEKNDGKIIAIKSYCEHNNIKFDYIDKILFYNKIKEHFGYEIKTAIKNTIREKSDLIRMII